MNKKKILLVDDEASLRDTISDLLLLNNYSVKTAANGQDALEILDYWTPDIIISDIMMPIMDGNLFHEIVRESNMLNQIPFVFLTAKNDKKEKEKCILNGVDLFISKPFQIENLIAIIEIKIERFEKIKNAYNIINANDNSHFMHEINTPLNGILDSINVLMNPKDCLEENEVESFYNSIKTSGESINRTLKNSILYQKLKNNKLDFQDNSCSEILDCFLKTKDEISDDDKKLAKRISFDIIPAQIKIKEEYLNFILFELMGNALRFSKNDKKIIVAGKIHNSEYYELVIQDFGIGLSAEELKEINDNQKLNRNQKEQQGLGLGLYISKTFMKKIRGVFSILSQQNVGTTIKLFFPLQVE